MSEPAPCAAIVWREPNAPPVPNDLLQAFVKRLRSTPGLKDIPIFSNQPLKGFEHQSAESMHGLLRRVVELQQRQGQDSIAVFDDCAPLFDTDLFADLSNAHFKYLAHFTYGENIPGGMLPDLASAEFVRALPEAIDSTLREHAFKNIDRYDVELFYRAPDLRQLRLDFSTKTARGQRLARDFLREDESLSYSLLSDFVDSKAALLRPFPSCVEIELVRDPGTVPEFLPDPPDRQVLKRETLEQLLEQMTTHALLHDTSFILGGLGEPLDHPDVLWLTERLLTADFTKRVYIETFGRNADVLHKAAALPNAVQLTIIVRLNTLKPDRYREMYGIDALNEVLHTIDELEKTDSECEVFAEMIRIKETEDEVESFYGLFEKKRVKPLLAKFNRYIDLFPDRRAVDLSPLTQDFCWHLARDFYITAEGTVPICKQDPFGRRADAPSLETKGLLQIWEARHPHHTASIRGKHDTIPMPCLQCDEWYTFNA